MRSSLFVLFLCGSALSVRSQAKEAIHVQVSPQELEVPRAVVGEPKTCTVNVMNNGADPVTISRLDVSCHCTTATLDSATILPGKKSVLRATITPPAPGSFNQVVTLRTPDRKAAVGWARFYGDAEYNLSAQPASLDSVVTCTAGNLPLGDILFSSRTGKLPASLEFNADREFLTLEKEMIDNERVKIRVGFRGPVAAGSFTPVIRAMSGGSEVFALNVRLRALPPVPCSGAFDWEFFPVNKAVESTVTLSECTAVDLIRVDPVDHVSFQAGSQRLQENRHQLTVKAVGQAAGPFVTEARISATKENGQKVEFLLPVRGGCY